MEFMRQCVLMRKNVTMVGWIDEISAKVGQHVHIHDEPKGEIWRVSMVGTHRITKTEAYKKRSDVFESIKK
jgi:hypothetical protein